jgi:TPR repeat protein
LGCLSYNYDKDFNKSVKYFKLAADNNCKKALNNLGVCYEQGEIEYL